MPIPDPVDVQLAGTAAAAWTDRASSAPVTLAKVFEGRRQLIAYYVMWFGGRTATQQCEAVQVRCLREVAPDIASPERPVAQVWRIG